MLASFTEEDTWESGLKDEQEVLPSRVGVKEKGGEEREKDVLSSGHERGCTVREG